MPLIINLTHCDDLITDALEQGHPLLFNLASWPREVNCRSPAVNVFDYASVEWGLTESSHVVYVQPEELPLVDFLCALGVCGHLSEETWHGIKLGLWDGPYLTRSYWTVTIVTTGLPRLGLMTRVSQHFSALLSPTSVFICLYQRTWSHNRRAAH